jgi:hypothetical protein
MVLGKYSAFMLVIQYERGKKELVKYFGLMYRYNLINVVRMLAFYEYIHILGCFVRWVSLRRM